MISVPEAKRAAIRLLAPALDVLMAPLLLLAAPAARVFRRVGAERLPLSRGLLRATGYWPLRRHYYDPIFHPGDLSRPLHARGPLHGIDWNLPGQRALLRELRYGDELRALEGADLGGGRTFSFLNGTFRSGDADFLYSFVRWSKPRRIVEIGCGNSTLLITAAVRANRAESPGYECRHVCVEPYEHAWLERLGIEVLRERVELVDPAYFSELEAGDLLFIDSSHIIRPEGDVLFEVLHVLPTLRPGVYVHFHDIFTPRHYLPEWLEERGYLWNEQYLLEAFLCNNSSYRVVAALNLLHHEHYEDLAAICAAHSPEREPGSFYIQRV